jgi:hypothetical protein
MKYYLFVFSVVCIIISLLPSTSWANSCFIAPDVERIEKTPIIFRGVPEATVLSSLRDLAYSADRSVGKVIAGFIPSTTFRILKTYKGTVEDSVAISGDVRFKPGEEYIVFTNTDLEVSHSHCNPSFSLTQANSQNYMVPSHMPMIILLEQYKAKQTAKNELEEVALVAKGMDELIEKFTSPGFREQLNDQKGRFLEEKGQLEEAKKAYEAALIDRYEQSKEREKKFIGGKGINLNSDIAVCEKEAPPTANTPSFLLPFPPPFPENRYINRGDDNLIEYGRVLFKLGEYQNAIRALCIAGAPWHPKHREKEAEEWKALALAKLGSMQ